MPKRNLCIKVMYKMRLYLVVSNKKIFDKKIYLKLFFFETKKIISEIS